MDNVNLAETYYSWVRDLPVIDWHNHLDMVALAADRPLGSLYETWVKTDPYKHRAMRICGEPERLITGDAPEAEKWEAWKRTLPKLVGNPLFDWAKAELGLLKISLDGRTEFGQIDNVSLAGWTSSKILRKVNAEALCPCVGSSALSSLSPAGALSGEAALGRAAPLIVPSLRLTAGEEVSQETLERFDTAGCRVVDISVDDTAMLAGNDASALQDSLFRVAAFAASRNWTMLLHLGALRETSSRLRAIAGPAGGYAAMRAPVAPAAVAQFLDSLERNGALPRTILLTLNPEAHAQLAVLTGSFTREGSPGHVQLGPAWWWCDHAHGVRDVLEKTAAYGVLSTFVGMTTDSRSILSLARHDWFRRVFCRWVAEKVASGDFPDDESLLKPLLEAVCYRNAKEIFVRSLEA
jgi:glucuronate isomerase